MIIPKESRWLTSVTQKLLQKRLDEAAEEYDLAQLEVIFTGTKAKVLKQAFDSGRIVGKNAEIRRLEMQDIEATDELIGQTFKEVEAMRLHLKSTTAQRKYNEDLLRIGLALMQRRDDV